MINGVVLLDTVKVLSDYNTLFFILLLIGAIISGIVITFAIVEGGYTMFMLACSALITCIIFMFTLPQTTQYRVYLTPEVNTAEFFDTYRVIKVSGKILDIQEKGQVE